MNKQHSPGPWIIWQDVEEDIDDDLDILQPGDSPESDRTVATVRSCRERIANAHLIAAAPEMLDLLELAVHLIRELNADNPYAVQFIKTVRETLAKAKGPTP